MGACAAFCAVSTAVTDSTPGSASTAFSAARRTGCNFLTTFHGAYNYGRGIAGALKKRYNAVMADGDLVTLAFAREYPDPKDPSARYTTTWFDMFRVADGMIVEHWDTALKQ